MTASKSFSKSNRMIMIWTSPGESLRQRTIGQHQHCWMRCERFLIDSFEELRDDLHQRLSVARFVIPENQPTAKPALVSCRPLGACPDRHCDGHLLQVNRLRLPLRG